MKKSILLLLVPVSLAFVTFTNGGSLPAKASPQLMPSLYFTIDAPGSNGALTLVYYEDSTPHSLSWTAKSGDGYPDHQYIKCKGPIPSGLWDVYEQGSVPSWPTSWPINMGMPLTCGRYGIHIHDWVAGATQGCIAVLNFSDFSWWLNYHWPENASSIPLDVSYPSAAYTYDPHPTCGELDAFEVSPDSISFRLEAGQESSNTTTLKNRDPTLKIESITRPVKKDGPSWISIDDPPSSMTAGSEETLTITAAPPPETPEGKYEATFTFEGKIGPYPPCDYTYETTVSLSVQAALTVYVGVPEFPVGGALEMTLMLVLIFVWLKKRRKIVRAPVP